MFIKKMFISSQRLDLFHINVILEYETYFKTTQCTWY